MLNFVYFALNRGFIAFLKDYYFLKEEITKIVWRWTVAGR